MANDAPDKKKVSIDVAEFVRTRDAVCCRMVVTRRKGARAQSQTAESSY